MQIKVLNTTLNHRPWQGWLHENPHWFPQRENALDAEFHIWAEVCSECYVWLVRPMLRDMMLCPPFPGVKAKVGSSPFLKCATQFPLILWHPYGRHYYFCVVTEKEQQKWHAVFQDCVRHANDGESCQQTEIHADTHAYGLTLTGHTVTLVLRLWKVQVQVRQKLLCAAVLIINVSLSN